MRRIGSADGHAALDVPALLTNNQLMVQVTSRQARCAGADVDADEWFPVATRWGKARAEAAQALALCAACPVRAECLELSLRQWSGAGRYGVWGGLLEGERATARKQWLAGITVTQLLAASHEDYSSGGHEEAARESADLPAKRATAMRHLRLPRLKRTAVDRRRSDVIRNTIAALPPLERIELP
jgi:WhiB family transcriptional regulator, redox-sensing transcriptional regulator